MASKEQMIDFIIRASTDSGFHGTFSKAQESFAKLGKEIQNLQRVQRDVTSYQKQQAAVERTDAKLKNLQDQYDLLQKEIKETEGPTTSLECESVKLDQRIRETGNALESQKQKLNATGERLQEAKVDTNDLEKADARLTEQLKALHAEQDRTAQSIENAAGSAEEFGETASSSFAAAGQALAAAGIVAGLKKITGAYHEYIQTAAGFGASMSYTGALSNASDAEMAALSTKAKEMGADKKFTAEESADAFGYMSLAGWKARQQITGIEPVLNLATAANMDLAKASDIVTDYLTAFGLTANDAAAFTDKMAYAMSHSNTDVIQLGEAYKNCASTAKSMNYSVEETTAVLMGMANAGVKGGEAGTALNAVMTRLATDTKGCATALAEYDVNVYDAKGNMNSLSEILSGMSRVWVTLSDAEQAALAKTIAGADHYSELQTIMSACSKEAEASGQSFSDYATALQDCSGTAAQMAERMLDNLSGDLVRMDSALEAVELTLGEQFTPELRKLTQFGTGALTILNQAMEKHPAAFKTITSFVSIMTLATGAVTSYGMAAKAVRALGLKDMFISAAPVLAVTAAVGGLAAVYTGLKTEWEASVPEVVALNGAVKDLSRTLEETSVHSIENEAQANAAAAAGMYLDKIEELGAVQDRTREQELRYQGAMAGLLQVAPELSDFISQTADEYGRVTYAVNGSTEAIRANIEVMKQQAVFDALQDRIKEITGPMGTAMMNIELAEIGRAELEEQYKEPLRQREEIQKKLNAAAGKSDAAAAVRNLNEVLHALDAQYGEVFSRVDAFDAQIAEANETVAEADEELLLYNKAMDGVAEKLGVAEDAAGDTAGAVDDLGGSFTDTQEAAKAFKEGLSKISEGVKDVTEAYQAAYDSAYSSVSGQYGLLEKAEKAVPAKLDVIQQALTTQAGYWDSYGQNLETLQQRAEGIAGLADYLARVADGSAESANILAGLVGLDDDELTEIAKADQALQAKWDTVSQQLTDMRGDWEGELDQWRDALAEAIQEMDQSDEAREAMEETIQALIDTANDPSLHARMQNALEGLVQIASISRIDLGSANGYASTAFLRMDRTGGYASGTENAERGWKLVGEEGPELMFFHGGERVWNAKDTAAALDNAPRYEAALAAPQIAAPVAVQITVNVQGNASQDTVDALRNCAEEIADTVTERVADRIREEQIDAVRRSFAT